MPSADPAQVEIVVKCHLCWGKRGTEIHNHSQSTNQQVFIEPRQVQS